MAFLSGSRGTLCIADAAVTPVTGWRLERFRRLKSYTANDTGGWCKRVAGPGDCRGRFTMQADDASRLAVAEGDSVTLALHVDASHYYEVPARIERIRTSVRISQGGPVPVVVCFVGNGPVAERWGAEG